MKIGIMLANFKVTAKNFSEIDLHQVGQVEELCEEEQVLDYKN
jgi:hypothetical protein